VNKDNDKTNVLVKLLNSFIVKALTRYLKIALQIKSSNKEFRIKGLKK